MTACAETEGVRELLPCPRCRCEIVPVDPRSAIHSYPEGVVVRRRAFDAGKHVIRSTRCNTEWEIDVTGAIGRCAAGAVVTRLNGRVI